MALDARQGMAEPPVEQMDVRAADADDLGAQHHLPRRGLVGPRPLQEVHGPLAGRHRRPHARDPTSSLDACWMHPHHATTDRPGVRQRRHPEAETF